jgi:hypothetical protein
MDVDLAPNGHNTGIASLASKATTMVQPVPDGREPTTFPRKFTRCERATGLAGVPILAQCASLFVGGVEWSMDFADHVGMLLDPVEVAQDSRGTR